MWNPMNKAVDNIFRRVLQLEMLRDSIQCWFQNTFSLVQTVLKSWCKLQQECSISATNHSMIQDHKSVSMCESALFKQ